MIVRGILARDVGRQGFVIIDYKRKFKQTVSRARRRGAPALQPLTGLVHHCADGFARTRQRLEHHEMPEPLVPVTLVGLVDHRRDSRDDISAVTRDEGSGVSFRGKRTFAGNDGILHRDQRRPVRGAVLIHALVKLDELGQRIRFNRLLNLERQFPPRR